MGKTYRNFLPIGVRLIKKSARVRNSGKKHPLWTIYIPVEIADDLCLRNKQELELYVSPLDKLFLVKIKEKDYAAHDEITRRILNKRRRGRPMTRNAIKNSQWNLYIKQSGRRLKIKKILENKLKNKNISDEQKESLKMNLELINKLIETDSRAIKKLKS
jgi:bifunctional DNA-binding transcriptional regulator/antitoxin component of YhaV-PrlF toxin-antitoxin module